MRALVRDPAAARAQLPDEVELIAGDVADRDACRRAAHAAEAVFICHGIYEQWVRDPAIFDAVNRSKCLALPRRRSRGPWRRSRD